MLIFKLLLHDIGNQLGTKLTILGRLGYVWGSYIQVGRNYYEENTNHSIIDNLFFIS